jgi:histidine triad (HIT) family protein
VQKKALASIVYEDKKTMAFMSIQPINIGHTLVVPKKHYENIYEISGEEISKI